ncbi:hypothetical protein OKE68_04320 [Riemerella anatipestifer]|uniref:Uncharacterized protein n=1 Tax=Riemerella anatipestifer TaxID=34085 RepID=A0AAP3EWB6_RIEAN|nr:hypothetical protein [Riemerella anatipestifer]AZZ59154.1 hypothetical protein AWB57_09050 [Riemerella anatipestifer]MBT0573731.1 hypothetical protein [Riemerella anatipestifer]MCU7567998.1 hypothetical protein [Riemerella anatipestifer]MCW0490019.1 hypothetical protein [Riemerella anatipestifer]MCW0510708.1 hypothetical protein [Riemerella anatipestifer]
MQQIFKDNPGLDVCYKTSDNKYFFTPNDAHNYASNLKDKNVEKLVRPIALDDVKKEDAPKEKVNTSDTEKKEDTANENAGTSEADKKEDAPKEKVNTSDVEKKEDSANENAGASETEKKEDTENKKVKTPKTKK